MEENDDKCDCGADLVKYDDGEIMLPPQYECGTAKNWRHTQALQFGREQPSRICYERQLSQQAQDIERLQGIITNFQRAFLWIETSGLKLTEEEVQALKELKNVGEWPAETPLFVHVEAKSEEGI